ncbi:hypothetical protein V1477_007551 [Vespula maculifrons]|uniref:Uncharacterized protein n=1 Tax=Vespula maculifrons TaxID=7453 RepID=A0ABD2CJJ4_VESMC
MHEACNVNAQPAKVQASRRTMILEGSRVRWIMASQSGRWLRGTGERHRAEGAVATAGQQRAAHGKQLRAGAEEPTGHGILLILTGRWKPVGRWVWFNRRRNALLPRSICADRKDERSVSPSSGLAVESSCHDFALIQCASKRSSLPRDYSKASHRRFAYRSGLLIPWFTARAKI